MLSCACKTLTIYTLFKQNQKLKFQLVSNGFHYTRRVKGNVLFKPTDFHSPYFVDFSRQNLLEHSPQFLYKTQRHLSGVASVGSIVNENLLSSFCNQKSDGQLKTLVDLTFGDGKHTKFLLENIGPVNIICLDRDPESYENARALSEKDKRVIPARGKFSDLPKILADLNYKFNSIDGMMLDCGISEGQAKSIRGFSIDSNSVLDMRMDMDGITAYDVLYSIDEYNLGKILKVYGEEKYSKKIARALIETRYTFKKVKTTSDLNELVSAVIGTDVRHDFQREEAQPVAQKVLNGLRRFVNNELNEINYAMIFAEKYLKPSGILVTSCNSIVEDKIIKRHLTGNVVENCANDMSLRFVSHNLTLDSEEMSHFTFSPWTMLTKVIPKNTDLKLRVAKKKVVE